jgi:tRNA 2-thiouridine synthesizing protein B
MLHIINRSPSSSDALVSCLQKTLPGQAILLIEDGVLAAVINSPWSALLLAKLSTTYWYALSADLRARGIAENTILAGIKILDYAGFVDLTVQYHPIQSWS